MTEPTPRTQIEPADAVAIPTPMTKAWSEMTHLEREYSNRIISLQTALDAALAGRDEAMKMTLYTDRQARDATKISEQAAQILELRKALERIAEDTLAHPLCMEDATEEEMTKEGGDMASITYWHQIARAAIASGEES